MEVPPFGLDSNAESRKARTRFLRAHAAEVYDELTSGRARRMRLAELVYLAAEYYPGLVPTEHRLAAERDWLAATLAAFDAAADGLNTKEDFNG